MNTSPRSNSPILRYFPIVWNEESSIHRFSPSSSPKKWNDRGSFDSSGSILRYLAFRQKREALASWSPSSWKIMKAMVDRKSLLTVKRFVCSIFRPRFHLSPILLLPPSHPRCMQLFSVFIFRLPFFLPPLFISSPFPFATPRFDELGQLVNRKGNECVHRTFALSFSIEGKIFFSSR